MDISSDTGGPMKIVPIDHGLSAYIAKSPGIRSTGLHMSDIYSDLYCDLEPNRFRRGSAPDPLLLAMGLSWEQYIDRCTDQRNRDFPQGEQVERPGEMIHVENGQEIAYSPDQIIFNGVTTLGEIKWTGSSSKDVPREAANSFPPHFDRYFTQMMAYCHCLGTPYARLLIMFTNRYPRPAELLSWSITFSKREIAENWSMLMTHAKHKGLLL
jgi:hypothetical protein